MKKLVMAVVLVAALALVLAVGVPALAAGVSWFNGDGGATTLSGNSPTHYQDVGSGGGSQISAPGVMNQTATPGAVLAEKGLPVTSTR